MRKTRSRFAAAQSEHTSSLRSWVMGNVNRSFLVFGVAAAIGIGGLLLQWNSSAAGDTPAGEAATAHPV